MWGYMMQAQRYSVVIDKTHRISLNLSDDFSEGPAEVIVLADRQSRKQPQRSLDDFLAALEKSPRRVMSKEEIDRYIEEERSSWEP
jgi:hypothetical protein